jgi:hypothetical protein
MVVLKKESLLMLKNLLGEPGLLVKNEPIILFDQGKKRRPFSFNSAITNKNSNNSTSPIQKDNYSNSLSVLENRILFVDDEPDLRYWPYLITKQGLMICYYWILKWIK